MAENFVLKIWNSPKNPVKILKQPKNRHPFGDSENMVVIFQGTKRKIASGGRDLQKIPLGNFEIRKIDSKLFRRSKKSQK